MFEYDIQGFILAMEHAVQNGCWNVWLESDLTSALIVFKFVDIVPIRLRNRWHKCLQVVSSHIFCEPNECEKKLANHGHVI